MKNFRYLCFTLICFFTQNIIAGEIDVMTQNQYVGAELAPLLSAVEDPGAFNEAVIGLLKQVADTKTTERIKALAALITKRQPHLVGLQEVYEFGCIDNPLNQIGACHDPSISGAFVDHLNETRAALNPDPLNPEYVDVARVDNSKLPPDEFPLPGIPFDLDRDRIVDAFVTVLDRDVIFKRSDVIHNVVDLPDDVCTQSKRSVNGCNYETALEVPVEFGGFPAFNFPFERGYVIVDATVRGKDYRFVNTHLEVKDFPDIQTEQARELITTLTALQQLEGKSEGKSLIVVGDINSSPEDQTGLPPYGMLVPPYQQFTANYTDAWTLRPGNADGFTCCQDFNLLNLESKLNERIDMIFSQKVPKKVKQAHVLGDEVSSKTPPPGRELWPSDHGSVAIELQFY